MKNAKVELLDSDGTVIETQLITGSVGNGKTVQKVFNQDTSVGRYVKVSMGRDCLHVS